MQSQKRKNKSLRPSGGHCLDQDHRVGIKARACPETKRQRAGNLSLLPSVLTDF
jgi:hypothetical protein